MDMEFEKYKALLEAVTPIIDEHFEMQNEYIQCKLGCSNCCEKGYYPVTRGEAKYLKEGFKQLPAASQKEITQKADKLSQEREAFTNAGNDFTKFKYICPFLIENKCSIYEYRPIICRTQGLILQSIKDDKSFNMPACVYIGLNYANIWDESIQFFSQEKFNTNGLKTPPVALDFSYESLLQACGINPDNLIENIKNPENDEIRMIFEWATSENNSK